MVVYLEVISKLVMVIGGKEANTQLPVCLQRAVEYGQAAACIVYLSTCLLRVIHSSKEN